MVYTQNLPK